MDNTDKIVENFELILKKQSYKKLSALYSNNIVQANEQNLNPQDVIASVFTQLKAIQTADCVKSGKCIGKEFNKYKEISFIPLNKLSEYKQVQKQNLANTNKFDTQCVSDTQLINIIDDAEALMNTNKGITQEFETSFHHLDTGEKQYNIQHIHDSCQTENVVDKPLKSDKKVSHKKYIYTRNCRKKECEIENIFNDKFDDINDVSDSISKNKLLDTKEYSQIFDSKVIEKTISGTDTLILSSESNKKIEITQGKDNNIDCGSSTNEERRNQEKIFNNCVRIEANKLENSERSPSPVFNIIKTVKIKTPSPLVFNLEAFENFENIAIPIIDGGLNIDTAKHLINSQILGKELHLKQDADIHLNKNEKELSHVFEDKKDELQILEGFENDTIKCNISDKEGTNNCNVTITEKFGDNLKDEILFSSDEESDNDIKQLQDLPFTCALTTPFHDKSDVSDKNMYVGFQTASNKSIQVNSDSFVKAKHILDDMNDACDKEQSLSELVQMSDNINFKLDKNMIKECVIINKQAKNKLETEATEIENKVDNMNLTKITELTNINRKNKNKCNEAWSYSQEICEYISTSNSNISKKDDFMTVNTNKIKVSNKVLDKCKKVFQDIDLEERFDIESVQTERNSMLSEVEPTLLCINETHTKAEAPCNKGSATEALIIQTKINDENRIQEFENIKMFLEDDKNKTIKQPLQFASFKTASNKNIRISDIALATTKNVFQDIDLTEISEEYKKENKSLMHISSPNNTKDIEVVQANDKTITNLNFEYIQAVDPSLNGFKTASNKKIAISEHALIKTRSVFQDIDCIELNIPDSRGSQNTDIKKKPEIRTNKTVNSFNEPSTNKAAFVEFINGNNNEIKISEDALSKTECNFKDFDKEIIKINKKTEKTLQGFKTASNKQVKISKEALIRSNKIFQDIEMTFNDTGQDIPLPSNKIQSSKALSCFKTANNELDNISAKSFGKSQNIFADSSATYTDSNQISNPSTLDGKKTYTTYYDFQTASNKPVTMSAEALVKSKKVFQDLDYTQMEKLPKQSSKTVNLMTNEVFSNFQGFQTASNKKVEISKEALEKTRKLFEDIDGIEKEAVTSFKGFQTASNKKVSISEHALAKSRQIFQDIDFDQENAEITKSISNIDKGINITNLKKIASIQFNTANNQSVEVSENSLKKSFEQLSELDKELYPKKITKAISDHKDENINLDNIINTQVLNNFEETLCTEDFYLETPRNKRSGSPILPCPKAKKKKKFETPYRNDQKDIKDTIPVDFIIKNKNMKFNDNYKKNIKFSLKDLLKIEKFKNKTEPIDMSFDNLLNFDFIAERNDLTQDKLTMDELKQLFIDSVDRKLIPDGWLDNHLKLVIWKLLSYEIKFPNSLNLVCTAKNVKEQLKYRYRRELYNAERPALRKILEKDDISSKTLILCIVCIYEDDQGVSVDSVTNTTKNIELLLTDGWYCIKASTDKMLAKLVSDKKIVVGSKIVTNGAELINCEQGISPWEDTSAVRLKLSGNSTRRARWDARLGYHGNGAILSQLSAVKVDGGKVSRLRVFVTRVYPMLYVEKFEDGSTVTRSERLEHLHQMKYDAERQVLLERLYEEVEKEFSDQESEDSECISDSSNKRKCMESGSQISKIMKKSKDPAEFRANLTSSQTKILQDHTSRRREKLLQDLQIRIQEKMKENRLFVTRNVVPLMRIRIAGGRETRSGVEVTKGMMSIWKPNDAVSELITEGAWIDVMNVVPTAIRYSEIQISAGRQSVFMQSKYKGNKKIIPYIKPLKRNCYLIKDLAQNPSMTTDYNEIDTVGFIFLIDPSNQEFESIKNQLFQNVYLTDTDKNFICINFWGGIRKFGFSNILDTGKVVACVNLQKRAGNTRKNIPQYRATEYSYFTKTPRNETAKIIIDEFNRELTELDRRKLCDDCVAKRNNYYAFKYHKDNENVSPYRLNNSDYNLLKHKMFIDTPLSIKSNKCEDFNLTGLDFESTFKQTETQELSPQTLLRKRRVKERISKLEMYGEPPPLSTVHLINKSKNATSSYKSPLISKSHACASVVTSNKSSEESLKTTAGGEKSDVQSSPVISMNTTYIKRSSVNPVKLNFSDNVAMGENNVSDLVDHFAEDFDGSPPLSLD